MNNLDKYFNSYKEGVKNVPFDKEEIEMKFFNKNRFKLYIPLLFALITAITSIYYFYSDEKVEIANLKINDNIAQIKAEESGNKQYEHSGTLTTIVGIDDVKNIVKKTVLPKVNENKYITYRDENFRIKSPISKNIESESTTFSGFLVSTGKGYSNPDELILSKSTNGSIPGVIIPVITADEAIKFGIKFENEVLNYKFIASDLFAKYSLKYNTNYRNSSKVQAFIRENYIPAMDTIEILQTVYLDLESIKNVDYWMIEDSLETTDYINDYQQIKVENYNDLEKTKENLPLPYLVAFKIKGMENEAVIHCSQYNNNIKNVDGLLNNLNLIPVVVNISNSNYIDKVVVWYPVTECLAKVLPDRYKRILEYELAILKNKSKELCEEVPAENFLGLCSNKLQNIEINNVYVGNDNSEINVNLKINVDLKINIKVYDMLGKEVGTFFSQEVGKGEFTKKLILNNLPKGIYILELTSNKGDYLTKRFITN